MPARSFFASRHFLISSFNCASKALGNGWLQEEREGGEGGERWEGTYVSDVTSHDREAASLGSVA